MKNTLDQLLDAGNDLINQIEHARGEIESRLSAIGGAANAVDEAVKDLSLQAQYLIRRIEEVRSGAPHARNHVASATVEAIDNLITLLSEAKNHLAAGEDAAACGTLMLFDEHAEDLKAAIRLCRMNQRRRR